jgi:hypothetical protein
MSPSTNFYHIASVVRGGHARHARDIAAGLGAEPGQYVLATIHRPENTDDPERLRAIRDELSKLGSPSCCRCTRGPPLPGAMLNEPVHARRAASPGRPGPRARLTYYRQHELVQAK